jgi:hypothetical protein
LSIALGTAQGLEDIVVTNHTHECLLVEVELFAYSFGIGLELMVRVGPWSKPKAQWAELLFGNSQFLRDGLVTGAKPALSLVDDVGHEALVASQALPHERI